MSNERADDIPEPFRSNPRAASVEAKRARRAAILRVVSEATGGIRKGTVEKLLREAE